MPKEPLKRGQTRETLPARYMSLKGRLIALKVRDEVLLHSLAQGLTRYQAAEVIGVTYHAAQMGLTRLKSHVGAASTEQLLYWWGTHPEVYKLPTTNN